MSPPGISSQATAHQSYQRGTLPRSGAQQNGNRESRLATIITVLIILATIILLAFSIYLASSQLRLFNLPFGNSGAAPTATTPITASVPDLKGLSYQEANNTAKKAGFNLQSSNGDTSGVVLKQTPAAGNPYTVGQTIEVTMGTPTTTVPDNLVGNTLAGAEAILNTANIPFTVKDAGPNPSKPSNTVKQVVPASGSTINVGQKVTLYVWNLNSTPTPSPSPSPKPSPSPTAKPSPSPTLTPTPKSTVTPIPTLTITPPTATATQTGSPQQPGNPITPSVPGPDIKSGSGGVTLEVAGLWMLLLLGLVRIRLRKRKDRDHP
jgi:hypothetical protein